MPQRGGDKADMIKLLHAADLHLDSPFSGLPSGKAAQRRQEQRELPGRLASLAEAEQVQLVLLAGDLFDSDSAFTETAEELIKALGSIAAPVFISPGNHDFYTASSAYARLPFPENVHIFRDDRIECVELPELNARVFGAAFTDRSCRGSFEGFSVEKKAGFTDIMCIHGELGGDRYRPITEEQLAASGMDYVALGHVHLESGLRRSGETYYAWPGCPEGRGFDETGEKHVYITELGDGECSIRPVCIAARRYGVITADLSDADPLQAVEAALAADPGIDCCRMILRGETDDAPDTELLRRSLEDSFFSLQLRDETTLRRELWDRAGEDSLRGQFLIRLRAAYDAAKSDAEREKITQAVRWGLAALDKREEVLTHGDK